MKRKIVQHGPCTLTVSLPAGWVRDFAVKKGDEINVEPMKNGLFISAGRDRHHGTKHINVSGVPQVIVKSLCALYKCGYDEMIVEYSRPEELEIIHQTVSNGFIGFEIIDETKEEVTIRKVSEPTHEEFKAIFRRVFRFLISTAEDGAEAAERHDTGALQKLIYRDENINKLTDFCRRVVNKRGQSDYNHDTALYHIIEQIEKIGDNYKDLNTLIMQRKGRVDKQTISVYRKVNLLLRQYEDIFFNFSLQKMQQFFVSYKELMKEAAEESRELHLLQNTARELYNLSGATMVLHL